MRTKNCPRRPSQQTRFREPEEPSRKDRVDPIPELDWRVSDNDVLGQPEAGLEVGLDICPLLGSAAFKLSGYPSTFLWTVSLSNRRMGQRRSLFREGLYVAVRETLPICLSVACLYACPPRFARRRQVSARRQGNSYP